MSSLHPAEKLILALDGMDKKEVFALLSKLPDLIWVKVGLELFTLCGPELITELRKQGKRIFLDLKFHDIPTTMARACFQAAKSKAELITVHACAGKNALIQSNKAAQEGARQVGMPAPTLLAVTVLTSWSDAHLQSELVLNQPISKRVEHFADLAFQAGLGGCVCSPLEVKDIRRKFFEPFQLITPGIRFLDSNSDDQERILTPSKALIAGASKLVLGRIITKASDPNDAFLRVCDELEVD